MSLWVFKKLGIKFEHELKSFQKNEIYQFSSRPLDIMSKDDFYVLSNGLLVGETSILNFNKKVYDLIVSEKVPTLISVLVAHYSSSTP